MAALTDALVTRRHMHTRASSSSLPTRLGGGGTSSSRGQGRRASGAGADIGRPPGVLLAGRVAMGRASRTTAEPSRERKDGEGKRKRVDQNDSKFGARTAAAVCPLIPSGDVVVRYCAN